MDSFERSFALALEQIILKELQGDKAKDVPGLYVTVTKGVPSWDLYNRMVGKIEAFEFVLNEATNLVRRQLASEPDDVVTTQTGHRGAMN